MAKFKGISKAVSQFKVLRDSITANEASKIAKIMVEESESITTAAKKLTPVDTGTLRVSGTSTLEIKEDVLSAKVTFGGPSAGYALEVHERLDVKHKVGQAKFLEVAFIEGKKKFIKRLHSLFKVQK